MGSPRTNKGEPLALAQWPPVLKARPSSSAFNCSSHETNTTTCCFYADSRRLA